MRCRRVTYLAHQLPQLSTLGLRHALPLARLHGCVGVLGLVGSRQRRGGGATGTRPGAPCCSRRLAVLPTPLPPQSLTHHQRVLLGFHASHLRRAHGVGLEARPRLHLCVCV